MTNIDSPRLRRIMETRMSVSKSYSCHRRQVLLPALVFLGMAASHSVLAEKPPAPSEPLVEMFEVDREKISAEMITIANRIANEIQYFDDDMRPIAITGSFDLDKKIFQFDMEERFGPHAGYDELADMHRTIENAIEPLTSRIEDFYAVSWTYGGKDIKHWMPRPRSDEGTSGWHVGASNAERATAPVVVAAGKVILLPRN